MNLPKWKTFFEKSKLGDVGSGYDYSIKMATAIFEGSVRSFKAKIGIERK